MLYYELLFNNKSLYYQPYDDEGGCYKQRLYT